MRSPGVNAGRMNTASHPVGDQLRQWRQRRRLSQLGLASKAEISQRHLSFLESGRSIPSREMVLRLADHLDVPLRERNALLLAAGYAPAYPVRAMDDPALAEAREAVALILKAHEPYPALAVDRHWTMVASNSAVSHLLADANPRLLAPPVNVLRISLHPDGLASRIGNYRQWRQHVFHRLQSQIDQTGDATLKALLDELKSYPTPAGAKPFRGGRPEYGGIVVPLQFTTGHGTLSFISTTTVFGTPLDIALSELAIESFFPMDEQTGAAMRRLAEG